MKRSEAYAIRASLDNLVVKIADVPAEVNENMLAIRKWASGSFGAGDVRMHEGTPYKCVQAHDSTGNPGWNPKDNPALWMQYHGTAPETARDWITPTGAHDMYLKGEYMIWTDGTVKRCLEDTAYGPDAYPQAWEDV